MPENMRMKTGLMRFGKRHRDLVLLCGSQKLIGSVAQIPNELQWDDQSRWQPGSHWRWSIRADVLTHPDPLAAALSCCLGVCHTVLITEDWVWSVLPHALTKGALL